MTRLCRDLWLLIHLPAETAGADRRDSCNGFLYQRRAWTNRKWGRVCFWNSAQNDSSLCSVYKRGRRQPHRDDEAPLLEVFDERNGVLFEVGQAAVDGLGVIVRSSLLLPPFVQPLLQSVVGAGQEHHQVGSADLPGDRGGFYEWQSDWYYLFHMRDVHKRAQSQGCKNGGTGDSGQNVKTAIYTRVKIPSSVRSGADGFMIFLLAVSFFLDLCIRMLNFRNTRWDYYLFRCFSQLTLLVRHDGIIYIYIYVFCRSVTRVRTQLRSHTHPSQ